MNQSVKKLFLSVVCIIVLTIIVFTAALWIKVQSINKQVLEIQQHLQESTEANKQVLDKLTEIQKQQQAIDQKLTQEKKERELHTQQIAYIKKVGYTPDSDLGNQTNFTSDDMNKIINYWIYHMGVSSKFKNKGAVFIQASKETGLNPIYILSHAAIESGWGDSYIARNKHNYFGINAIDIDPGQSYAMGNNLDEGIRTGAKWIQKNYYSNGYTSLASMKRAGYATSPTWSSSICHVMNASLQAL